MMGQFRNILIPILILAKSILDSDSKISLRKWENAKFISYGTIINNYQLFTLFRILFLHQFVELKKQNLLHWISVLCSISAPNIEHQACFCSQDAGGRSVSDRGCEECGCTGTRDLTQSILCRHSGRETRG